jgi:hypothetical protein
MKSVGCLVSLLVLGFGSAMPAQQAVPPPPKPADSGPTLQATMGFLQDKLGDIGVVTFIVMSHDSSAGNDFSNKFTNEVTRLNVDAGSCRITYHWKTTRDGGKLQRWILGSRCTMWKMLW